MKLDGLRDKFTTPSFLIEKLKNYFSSPSKSTIKQQFIDFCERINQSNIGVQPSVIGLDISEGVMRLVKFTRRQGHYELDMYRSIDLPPGVLVNNQLKDPAKISAEFVKLLEDINQKDQIIAIAIPKSLSIIKSFVIDKRLNEEEIESRAWIEAEHHFPNLINTIFLDFAVTGDVKGNPAQAEVTLVASRKEHVKPYLELAKQANCDIDLVDVDCFALSRATRLLGLNEDKTVVLINLGKSISSLIVMQNDQMIFTHDQSFNGKQLLSRLEGLAAEPGFNIDADAATLLENPVYQQLLRENILSHINHCIHFLYASRPDITVDQLYLAGECATIPGLCPFVQNETSMACTIAVPKMLLETEGAIGEKDFIKDAPKAMLCCGLAMSQVEV